jgi:hypothetical protein
MRDDAIMLIVRMRNRIDVGTVVESGDTTEIGAVYSAMLESDHSSTGVPPIEAAFANVTRLILILRIDRRSELRHVGLCVRLPSRRNATVASRT